MVVSGATREVQSQLIEIWIMEGGVMLDMSPCFRMEHSCLCLAGLSFILLFPIDEKRENRRVFCVTDWRLGGNF